MKLEVHFYYHNAPEESGSIQSQLTAIIESQKEIKKDMANLETRLQGILKGVKEGNAKADEALALIAELKEKVAAGDANAADMAASEDELTELEILVGATKVEVPAEPAEETTGETTEAPAGETSGETEG